MTIVGTPNSNIGLNNDLYDKIMGRQPASTLNTNDNKGQPLPPQKESYNVDPIDKIRTGPIIHFKRTKQVIMGIDALSLTPGPCNKILYECNHNGFCQYKKLHKTYIFVPFNCVVISFHILMFLKKHPYAMSSNHTPISGIK